MNGSLADQMLEEINSVSSTDREPTVKLDQDTLRVVNKWKKTNLRTTVSWMCKIADEALEDAKRNRERQSQ